MSELVPPQIRKFFDDQGRLVQWPNKRLAKDLVIAYLATKFEMDHSYTEMQVNEILNRWHTFSDWPLLRRELFDRGYLGRELSGATYWLIAQLNRDLLD
jgi:hypothetical protein